MGQKVPPTSLRLGINRGWESSWYASPKNFADLLHQDLALRKVIENYFPKEIIAKAVIERTLKQVEITLHTGKPGLVIGAGGARILELTEKLKKKFGIGVQLNVFEIKKPETDARLVAESIAAQLSKRGSYRRAAKIALSNAMRLGIGGIKIRIGGRLNGREIAGDETFMEGSVPQTTLKADIDYALAKAHTIYGVLGVKVWIYKGLVHGKRDLSLNFDAKRTRKV